MKYVFCKYFLPVCGLSSHSHDSVIGGEKVLILMKSRSLIIHFVALTAQMSPLHPFLILYLP